MKIEAARAVCKLARLLLKFKILTEKDVDLITNIVTVRHLEESIYLKQKASGGKQDEANKSDDTK